MKQKAGVFFKWNADTKRSLKKKCAQLDVSMSDVVEILVERWLESTNNDK